MIRNEGGCLRESADHHDVGEQLADRAGKLGGARHQVGGPAGAARQGGTRAAGHGPVAGGAVRARR